jgi:hypothetical protein
MNQINRIKLLLKRVYRLSRNHEKHSEIVWSDLKKFHIDEGLKHGVNEKDKYIETRFKIHQEQGAAFWYMVNENYFHCRVKVLDFFPEELTTDIFVLAAHLNNVLNRGVVTVDVDDRYVGFQIKSPLLIPLLYHAEMWHQINLHKDLAQDIYKAFQRLVCEQEAPAIIIADLLKQYNQPTEGDQT